MKGPALFEIYLKVEDGTVVKDWVWASAAHRQWDRWLGRLRGWSRVTRARMHRQAVIGSVYGFCEQCQMHVEPMCQHEENK